MTDGSVNIEKPTKTILKMLGRRFGKLLVLEYIGRIGTRYYVSVLCDCGVQKVTMSSNIWNRGVVSCGCTRKRNCPIGNKYNKLTILSDLGRVGDKYYVRCMCDCGNVKDIREDKVVYGGVKSCGCYANEVSVKLSDYWKTYRESVNYKPYSPTITYTTWASMRSRCYNINGRGHKKYAGRGISVCEGWMGNNGYVNFLKDMGERPSVYYSIDRVDGKLHYSCGRCNECIKNKWPSNCRWATSEEQANNLSVNKYVTLNGEKISCHTADRRLGYPYGTVYRRMFLYGWSEEDSLHIPPSRKNKSPYKHKRQFRRNSKTGYKGVVEIGVGKYAARIYIDGSAKHLGTFYTPKEAAVAFNKEAVRLYGKNAKLNEV